eukprot:4507878-Lingulodinium_polyedra.AAC.1
MLKLRMKMASSGSGFKQLSPAVAPGTMQTVESVAATWAASEEATQAEYITVTIQPATESQVAAPLPWVRPVVQRSM